MGYGTAGTLYNSDGFYSFTLPLCGRKLMTVSDAGSQRSGDMFDMTKRQRADLLGAIEAQWETVIQDRFLVNLTFRGFGPVEPEYVALTLDFLLSKVLRDEFGPKRGAVRVEHGTFRLVTEGASEAAITFRGETKTVTVPGMTRLAGTFTLNGESVHVAPTWVGHPFWQYRRRRGRKPNEAARATRVRRGGAT